MKVKYYLLSIALMGMLTACSGEKKESAASEKSTTEKNVEEDQPTGDVFIYTSEHRHEKAQPDKANLISGLMITAVAGGGAATPLIGLATDMAGSITAGIFVLLLCAGYLANCAFCVKIQRNETI